MQTEHSPFPSDETLAAYIDGRLDEETRRRVVEHMAECEECFDVVMAGRESGTSIERASGAIAGHNRWIAFAAAAAVVIVASAGILSSVLDKDKDLKRLTAAMPPFRTIEGRVTTMPHKPLNRPMRGGED